ncbi:MAG: hypothetical protein V8T86_03300 [Victivallis sp.]
MQDGTLHVGDTILCGEHYGRSRTLINDKGERVKTAGPSVPVKVVGLSGVPEAGDRLEDLRIRESGAGRGAGAGRRQTRQHARHQRHRNGGGPVQQAQQQ